MKKRCFFMLLLIAHLTAISGFSQKSTSYFSDINENNVLKNNVTLLQSNNSLVNVNQVLNQKNVNLVVLNQVGLNNMADISQSKNASQIVGQFGNNNYYSFKDFYNSSPKNLSILQTGNFNSLEIYGTNNLTNGMKIIQNKSAESSQSLQGITITNYKY